MKNAKAKGTRAELRSRNLLEHAGWRVARFAGSFGPFDLIAFSPTAILLIQVKCGRWPNAKELRKIRKFPAPPECRKTIHRWMRGDKVPDLKLVGA